jgi:hypothetical protein
MSRSRFPLFFGTAAVLAVGAYYLGRAREVPVATDTPSAPAHEFTGPLVVESSSLDLGEVWEEPEYVHTLPVHNRGSQEVKVTDIATPCGCVSVNPRSFSVSPSGSTQVAVTLDLTSRPQGALGQDVRPFSVEVHPLFTGTQLPRATRGWTLTARVKSRVTLDALALNFGERPMQGVPAEPRSLVATVHVPCQRLEVATRGGGVNANTRRLDPTGNRYEITFTPDTIALPVGSFKATATVSVVTPSGETLFGARLPVEGTVRPELNLLPARLILGAKPVGETASGTLVLQGAAGNDLAVQQIETDSSDVTVTPVAVEIAPGARAWRVTQRISKAGDQSSTVCFVFTRAGRQIKATVIVSSFGETRVGKSTNGHPGRE